MSDSNLVAESWVWFALTLTVVLARMVSRRLLRGSFKKLQMDDYLMAVAMITYTILLVGVKILNHTPTNLIDPNDATIVLTPESIVTRAYGSKWVLVVEQMQIATIWTVKVCLLIMYSRLTMSLKQNFLVKITAAYVAFGFLFMEITFFGAWCRPFSNYWEVPVQSIQCSAERNHMITNAVFNITSDLMIISLPMPIFLQAQLQLEKKAILMGVFALGIFTIFCAILNKYYSFSETYGTQWIFWYIREASTAIIVANLPLTWTLLQRMFRISSFSGRSTRPRVSVENLRHRPIYGNLPSRAQDRRPKMRTEDQDSSQSESHEYPAYPDYSQYGSQEYGIYRVLPLETYQNNEITLEDFEANSGRMLPLIPTRPEYTLQRSRDSDVVQT